VAPVSYPRWVAGKEAVLPPVRLREVAHGVYVGNEGSVRALADALDGRVGVIRLATASSTPRVVALVDLPVEDGEPIPDHVIEAAVLHARDIRAAGLPLLLACYAGLSRSASIAYAVLRDMGVTHAEALRRVRSSAALRQWPHPVTLDSVVRWVARQERR